MILTTYGFKLSPKKCAVFRKHIRNLPLWISYKYLGRTIYDRGLHTGKTKVVKCVKEKCKKIAKIGKCNPLKGLRLLMSLCGRLINFHISRQVIALNPGTLVKQALGLNRGLNNEMTTETAMVILGKKNNQDEYAREIIFLAKLNGVKDSKGGKFTVIWSNWFLSLELARREGKSLKKISLR